ncbi:MAG: two-component regulator propeller domain-containing protein [Bacteroidota bacterium]|nr:two-component regulator propeller domain-containing protein [Bacteroidota bacterium]
MIKKQYLFILLLLFIWNVVFAQNNPHQYKFSALGVDDGLSQNSVWDVIQTHDGFLWIGTADGINRYDGNTFKVYKHENGNPCSVTGQNFPRFYEDKNNTLWVSDDRGISVYQKEKDCFKNVYQLKKAPMRYYSNSFIGEDDRNGLIVFLADELIACFDKTSFKITQLKGFNKDKQLQQIDLSNPPVLFRSTAYFTLGEYHLMELNLNTLNAVLYQHKIRLGKAIIQHSQTQILFVIGDTLCLFDIRTKQKIYSRITDGIVPEPEFSPLHVIKYDNNYWYSSRNGMYIFNPKTLKFTRHLTRFSNSDEDNYTYVTSSYGDLSNNLWICTNGDGVKMFSPYRNKFNHYKTNSKKTNLIKAVCRTSNGMIFTASYREPITVFDEKTGNFQTLHLPVAELAQNGSILCLSPVHGNRIAFVCKNSLYTYNYLTKEIKLLITPGKPSSLKNFFPGNISYSTFKTVSENLLFVNLGTHVLQLTFLANGSFQFKSIFYNKDNISTAIEFDPHGKLWLGTMSGLFIIDTINKSSIPLLQKVFVKCILSTKNNIMYVATQNGLYQFNNGLQSAHYTMKNGLPDDFIYGILEDRNRNIWVSHNKGISCFDPRQKSFKNYTLKDGLQSNEFNTGAYFKDENGKLYFGGINGFNVFDPDSIMINKHPPDVQIISVKLFEEPLKTDSNISSIHQIRLSHDNNTLSFDFAALEFGNHELNQYAYKLDGYDKDWIYSGNKHYTRYANLPFGSYQFQVKAANSDGIWNNIPKSLQIIITPPFWRTIWFYFFSALLGLSIIGTSLYFIVYRQRLKLKRELELQLKLESERIRIARDLHDNVGAQLSYLITNIDWMLENPDALNEQETNKRLSNLSETGKQAILTLRQTIWAINNKELSVEDLADRFKQFVLKMMAFNKKIQLHVEENIDESMVLGPGVALNLFRICQEAFNNCIKHSDCLNIKISIKSNSTHRFFFRLDDDGIGFNPEHAIKTGHYGLQNMHSRAEETGSKLTIDSTSGGGTRITLSFTN